MCIQSSDLINTRIQVPVVFCSSPLWILFHSTYQLSVSFLFSQSSIKTESSFEIEPAASTAWAPTTWRSWPRNCPWPSSSAPRTSSSSIGWPDWCPSPTTSSCSGSCWYYPRWPPRLELTVNIIYIRSFNHKWHTAHVHNQRTGYTKYCAYRPSKHVSYPIG